MLKKYYKTSNFEAGTDEAGRGCLAGPVTAAAIILPSNFENSLLNDSKLLTEKNRKLLKPILISECTCHAIVHLDASIIDEINILNASIKAMQECVLNLNLKPEYLILDGNSPFIPKKGICNKIGRIFNSNEIVFLETLPSKSIIKGDSKYMSIAAASVLAKTARDEYMNKIHEEFPMYNWKKNKGYPTKEHREAIKKYGTTKYHRMSFKLLPNQFELEL